MYLPEGGQWHRAVIEDKMDNGHALAVGDLDGDGRDEIVSGFRGPGLPVVDIPGGGRARRALAEDRLGRWRHCRRRLRRRRLDRRRPA